YTRLVADSSGVITAIDAEPGQVVAAGTPVLRIAHDGPRDIVFSVPEDRVSRLRVGSPVVVRPWGAGTDLKGSVREWSASSDPVTRTYGVKVTLDTKESPPLGSTVSVALQTPGAGERSVIKLPTSAVRQDGKSSAVWLLDPATLTVRSQPIEVATVDGNDVVVAAGLQPGMLVVSAGVHALSHGQKVTLYRAKESGMGQEGGATPAADPAGATRAAGK
ncbi:MAG: efflux RND transporter periplasmic adaptor subunit, partial [Rhodoferax sp.]|nr:efflux RND transporter periplasmic adaptor subunit [Rhodoferax sp.]